MEIKNCWIITEGIAGTENQCIAVAEALGCPFEVKRISLSFPYNYLSPHIIKKAPKHSINGIDWNLAAPDLIIASGRKAVPVALNFPNSFKVFIQDPQIDPSYFDLVASPAHDNLNGDNVITTVAAPNRVTPTLLNNAAVEHPFPTLKGQKIAVLIGGNSKTHTIPFDFADMLNRQLTPYLQSPDYAFMVTASRRTPDRIKQQLQSIFDGKNCHFWDGTGNNPYHAYLAHADYILVTEDSTSMLSDACSTGKPVYRLPLKGGSPKFTRLYNALKKQCHVTIFNGNLDKKSYKPLDDAQMIADKIRKSFAKQGVSP